MDAGGRVMQEQLPRDADTDDCMDAGGRATQEAKAERTGKYLQRVMSEGYSSLMWQLEVGA